MQPLPPVDKDGREQSSYPCQPSLWQGLEPPCTQVLLGREKWGVKRRAPGTVSMFSQLLWGPWFPVPGTIVKVHWVLAEKNGPKALL